MINHRKYLLPHGINGNNKWVGAGCKDRTINSTEHLDNPDIYKRKIFLAIVGRGEA